MTTGHTPHDLGSSAQLCGYTSAILDQMVSVIQPYLGEHQPDYAAHVGAHIRHIIEHYDTLVMALSAPKLAPDAAYVADYDARARSLDVEADPSEALRRIALIEAAFGARAGMSDAAMLHPVHVYTRGGLMGEHNFCTPSTVAREIMFLNSHATHHFAILQGYARQRGQNLGPGVGKAPATIAHEQRLINSQAAA